MRPLVKFCSRWDIAALLYFLFLSLLMRLPFFFEAVINWDESTFILLGQSLLDGHLPYTELWDVKPPFVAGAFALFILLLGKSIASVRLAGTLCVTLTAWFTYIIGRTIWTPRTGAIGGTLFVLSMSLLSDGRPTMTEHVALVPMMGAAIIAVTATKLTLRRLFWIGLWLTVATMIRLNLAYVTLIVGVYTVLMPFSKKRLGLPLLWEAALRGCTYTAGSLLVIFTTVLPYLVTNQFSVWWESVVVASLSYSSSQLSFWAILYTWLGGAGLGIVAIRWRSTTLAQRSRSLFLGCLFSSTLFSIGLGGATYSHYLIQIFPFVALLLAIGCDALLKRTHRWQTPAALFLIIAMAFSSVIPKYREVYLQLRSGQGLDPGAAYEIADYLKQANPEREPVYMMTEHIVYWFIDGKPLTASTTHPSNVVKDYLLDVIVGPGTTSEMEMAKIFSQKPAFVVKLEGLSYLETQPSAATYLEQLLQSDYELVKVIEGQGIYQRR